MQRWVSWLQQPPPAQRFPSQHACPEAPQASQVVSTQVRPETVQKSPAWSFVPFELPRQQPASAVPHVPPPNPPSLTQPPLTHCRPRESPQLAPLAAQTPDTQHAPLAAHCSVSQHGCVAPPHAAVCPLRQTLPPPTPCPDDTHVPLLQHPPPAHAGLPEQHACPGPP